MMPSRKDVAISTCVFLGASVFSTGLVHSKEPFIQIERIENCIRFSEDRYQCIGSAAGACSDLPSGGSIEGMLTCTSLERAYWLKHGEESLMAILKVAAASDSSRFSQPDFSSLEIGIKEMQAGWIKFRDALCKTKNHSVTEGSLRTNYCLIQQDGEQALYLLWLSEQHF